MPAASAFDVTLTRAEMITPSVRRLAFDRADGNAFDFSPGQWVNLVLPLPDGEIKRAYSIASPPDGSSSLELVVTRVEGGPGSEFLHRIEPGATLRAIGPQGFFTREAGDPAPALFVATGTGLAPFRSMLLAALGAGCSAPLWVLFGARREADILFREELAAIARERPHVRHEVTLSRPGEGWSGRAGHVQAHVPELWRALVEASPAPPHVFICGLDRMVSSVKEMCRGELGVDRRRVHVERYD